MTMTAFGLAIGLIVSILVLGKGADWLVESAVHVSTRSGIPKFVVATTILSLGTTLPEMTVSVMAALNGKPGLALGNAVGSILCDTGLILGACCLIGTIPTSDPSIRRSSSIQIGCALLLVLLAAPWGQLSAVAQTGGRLPQWGGWVMLVALAVYMIQSVRGARNTTASDTGEETDSETSIPIELARMAIAIGLVVISSQALIAFATESATRIGVPETVIAATLVALGTSFPELVTGVTAVLKGHGEIAIGNVVGADILNVLFVAGAAASVTPGGLVADPHFFTILFPCMIGILAVFKIGVHAYPDYLRKSFGVVLLIIYAGAIALSYQ